MVDLKGVKKEIKHDAVKVIYANKINETIKKIEDKIKNEQQELNLAESEKGIITEKKINELKLSIEQKKSQLTTLKNAKKNTDFLDSGALQILLMFGMGGGIGIAFALAAGQSAYIDMMAILATNPAFWIPATLAGFIGGIGAYGLYRGGKYLGKKLKGWPSEKYRHALAAKGIKTWRKKK